MLYHQQDYKPRGRSVSDGEGLRGSEACDLDAGMTDLDGGTSCRGSSKVEGQRISPFPAFAVSRLSIRGEKRLLVVTTGDCFT